MYLSCIQYDQASYGSEGGRPNGRQDTQECTGQSAHRSGRLPSEIQVRRITVDNRSISMGRLNTVSQGAAVHEAGPMGLRGAHRGDYGGGKDICLY